MRIGIDARMYRSGVAGIGRYSQNLIKNLLEIDNLNQYVLFMRPADKIEFDKLKIENSLKIKNCKLKIVETDIPHFSLDEQTKLPKIIEKEKLDLMHFLNFNHPVSYRGKFITVIHDLTLIFYPETAKKTNFVKRFAFRYVISEACKDSAKIIAVSENTKKDIMEIFKAPEDKIKVIYEAADDKIFQKVNDRLQHKLMKRYALGDKPVILYAGQFRPHKNLIGLIEAFNILRKEISCKLVILGRRDDRHISLKKAVDKSEFRENIIMPGFVLDKELSAWYKIATVFVIPSFYEGFGLPGLEAMTAGVPVVSSNKASLPEIYQDGAIYFDPFEIKDIADKIKMVLKDKGLQSKLIQGGKKIASLYSWRKTALQTLEIYKEIQNQKSK